MNKSENPRRRSTSLQIIALVAALAVLFWSIQANAYPRHNGEYLFWPEMPAAAQVLTDMKGTNDFDTAAQQRAALGLLRDLVRVDIDGKGPPWSAHQQELDSAYMHALAGVNGNTYEIKEAALRLQASPSFVEPFLKRYFPEAAVREIEPMVPDFKAAALKDVAEVEAFAKRDAGRQKAAEPNQSAVPASAQKKTEESSALAQLKAAIQGAGEDKLGVCIFIGIIITYLALAVIFGIQWFFRVCRAFRTIRITSDDPPRIEGPWKNQKICSFTGRVHGKETQSDTFVSGSIRIVDNQVQGGITSATRVTNSFRLVNPRNQQEKNFTVQNYHLQLWEDQLVSVAWAIPEHQTAGRVFIVVNHTASNEIFTSRVDLWEVAYPRYRRLMNWGVLTWFPFPPIYLLVLFWAILMNIQTSKFRRSGIQPLVEALNQKAKEFQSM